MIHIEGADEIKKEEAEAKKAEEAAEEAADTEETETAETEEAGAAKTEEPESDESAETEEEEAQEDEDDADPEEASEEDADEPADDADDKKDKRSRRQRRKDDKKDEQIRELQDKYKRQIAEFDNFRKRTEKEKSMMYAMGAKDVLEQMLNILDNFERGLEAIEEEDKDDAFVQGMQMVYKQMTETLEKLGVKPIEAVGKPFDPNFHNAVMHEENEEAGENEVVAEFQKGYLYHDDVIRHSMVKVAN